METMSILTESRSGRRSSSRTANTSTREHHWQDDAACQGHDPMLFTLHDGTGHAITNKANFEEAEIICSTCPVFSECWESANSTDKMVTMRAGAWPELYRSPQDDRPQGGRPRVEQCKRGHDTTQANQRDKSGQCNKCRAQGRRERYAAAKLASVE